MTRRDRVPGRTRNDTRSCQPGMTLLELLLALGLTGVVMVVISMAIHLHLITVDTRRADIEQAQVARGVLQHIAADIRNTVWYEPLEMPSVSETASTTDATGSTAPDQSGSQPATGGEIAEPAAIAEPAEQPGGADQFGRALVRGHGQP